jgi:glycosyltransferase involved in cell wall biosynthesis
MKLNVLSVAYPLAPVGLDAVGGAEQVLAAIDDALMAAGHRSTVLACEGSETAGELVCPGRLPDLLDDAAKQAARHRHRETLAEVLKSRRFDVVHFHGVDVADYLPPPKLPTVITVHLPPDWYPADLFRPRPASVLVAVSAAQRGSFPETAGETRVIRNGIPLELYARRHAKRGFVLALGRICPEKGFHLALDAARRAGLPLLLGGTVYPYPEHLKYFDEEIRPRLNGQRRYLGPLSFHRKRRLLAATRCLAIPTLVAETGALVAMEALASGTPVVAFPQGALTEIVIDGQNGFLVQTTDEMAEAMHAAANLDPAACQASAARFNQKQMIAAYFDLYAELAMVRIGAD